MKKYLILLGTALLWFLLLSVCLIIFAPHSLGLAAHEYLGMLLTVLLLWHVGRNRYVFSPSAYRSAAPAVLLKNLTSLLLLLSFVIMVASGVFISTTLFEQLDLPGSGEARRVHLGLASYAQLFLGLHLGMHLTSLQSLLTAQLGRRLTLGILSLLVICALNGAVVFWEGDYRSKLCFEQSFSFWDYDRPLLLSYIDMASVLCWYALLGLGLIKAAALKRN